MIRDGYVNIYGVITEDYVEGDPLPCPHCRRSDTAKVIRSLEFEPQGFRLGCVHCGYEIPENMTVYDHDSAKGIKAEIDVWDRMRVYVSMKEELKNTREIVDSYEE